MTTGTVLTLAQITPVPGPDSALPARVCAAINALDPVPPLVIVAEGRLALLLPAVALSQRSSHRRVSAYILIDPELPAVTDGWPDAPVTVVTDVADGPVSRQAALRDWRMVTHAQYAEQRDRGTSPPP